MKGLLFQGTRTYFKGERQWDALLAALRPELSAFMQQRFIPGVFYEALVVPELIQVEAAICKLSVEEYLARRTRWQANRDLRGVYRVVIRMAPPEFTVSRLMMVMTQMFNFGSATVTGSGRGHLEVEVGGVPRILAAWLNQTIGLYGEICLKMAGTTEAEVLPHDIQDESDVFGHPTVRLSFRCRWVR